MSMQIIPLTPLIGAEIHAIDLTAELSDATINSIRRALSDHLIVVFRDQPMSVESLEAFGRRFGPPHIHPSDPGIAGNPSILPVHTDASSKTYAGSMWHSDVSCDEEPPMGSILHLHEVPEIGGDTLFASMYGAYDALSDTMKGCLQGLKAINASEHHFKGYFGAYDKHPLRNDPYPEALHPVVRTHPDTGKKALFVNPTFTTHIAGMQPDESQAILSFLYQHLAQPRFQCRIKWQRNTIAMWDNRCTQHHAMWDYYPHTRSGHRYTIEGDRPF